MAATLSIDCTEWAVSTLGACSAQARGVWWELAIRHASGAATPSDVAAAARLYRVDATVYAAAIEELSTLGLYPIGSAPPIVADVPQPNTDRQREASRERSRRFRERHSPQRDANAPERDGERDAKRDANAPERDAKRDAKRDGERDANVTPRASQGGVGGDSAPSSPFLVPKSIQPPPASSGGRAEKRAAAAFQETESVKALRLAGVSDVGTLARLADTPLPIVRAAVAKANKRKGGPGGPGLIVTIIDAGDVKPERDNPAHNAAREFLSTLPPNPLTDRVNTYRNAYSHVPGMDRVPESKVIESRAFLDWIARGLERSAAQ